MKPEDKLKYYILTRYRSLLEFTQSIGMPYATLQSILKRGIGNSSITNIIKICRALNISANDLADGEIVPLCVSETEECVDLVFALSINRNTPFCVDGIKLTDQERETLFDGLEIIIEQIRRKRK